MKRYVTLRTENIKPDRQLLSQDFNGQSTVRCRIVFVTRPPALVMSASSSALRRLGPAASAVAGAGWAPGLSSTASPRRDATRGSRFLPASQKGTSESEETRPASRWSNPSQSRPALDATWRRTRGGARAQVIVPIQNLNTPNWAWGQPQLLPSVKRTIWARGRAPAAGRVWRLDDAVKPFPPDLVALDPNHVSTPLLTV